MELEIICVLLCILILIILQSFKLFISNSYKTVIYTSCSEAKPLKSLPALPLRTLPLIAWSYTGWLRCVGKSGPIVQYSFWKLRFTIINDFQLGKELFKNPIFCGKQTTEFYTLYTRGAFGISSSDGKRWKEQKRFCQQHLKDFGLGTKSMETIITTEIEHLLKSWKLKEGQVFCPNMEFYLPVLNSMWVILTGKRASSEDKELVDLVYRVYEGFKKALDFPDVILVMCKLQVATLRRIARCFPIFPGITGFDASVNELRSYFRKTIALKKNNLPPNENTAPTNLVDAYLLEASKAANQESEFVGTKGELHLLAIMSEFFIAGGDTTATMLTWAMLHLIRNTDIQEKIRQEIKTAVGSDRYPSLLDKINCPYTEAFIYEVLRFKPVAATSMPHATTEDANIGPCFIQKGTLVFLNIYSICHDSKIWVDPENFRPERFLSSDGKVVVKNEAMCAFSLGQRRCMGEVTARDTLFLFVSAICQRFRLQPEPNLKGKPRLSELRSGLLSPATFNITATAIEC